jgi:hypothetical protein
LVGKQPRFLTELGVIPIRIRTSDVLWLPWPTLRRLRRRRKLKA